MKNKKSPKSVEQLITEAVINLATAQEQIRAQVSDHDKIISYQALQINNLEKNVMNLRNAAIVTELKLGTPSMEVAAKYGLSPGRVSQIKKSN